MKQLLAIFFVIGSIDSMGQSIPNKANLIKVKGVTFSQVCNTLLDSGYVIEKKDDQLQTVTTEMREYTKSFNAAYRLIIRVKDSVAIIYSTFSAPWWDPFTKNAAKTDRLWDNTRSFVIVDKKGKAKLNQMNAYPFERMMRIGRALGSDMEFFVSE